MRAEEVLAQVLQAGGRVIPDPERPRLLVPPALKPLVVEHRKALRSVALYWNALQRWSELTAQGLAADRDEIAWVHQDLLRLIDEVGEPMATRLRRQWARDWWEETGVCPLCGERGPYHDPERRGEPSERTG